MAVSALSTAAMTATDYDDIIRAKWIGDDATAQILIQLINRFDDDASRWLQATIDSAILN